MEMSSIQRLRSLKTGIQWARLASTASGQNVAATQRPKAVIFDVGGVILPSPGGFFLDYEKSLGLSRGTLVKTIMNSGPDGAWQRLERGEISSEEFGKLLSKEYTKITGKTADLSSLFDGFVRMCTEAKPFPQILDAVKCLRAEGIKTALLTNNVVVPKSLNMTRSFRFDIQLFDVIVESAKSGMRKPEPRIYQHMLELLKVKPEQAVFLDDIGENLKAARDLGIRTIKVTGPDQAISELEREVGLSLRGFAEGTTSVPDRLKIPIDRLKSYLSSTLNVTSQDDPVVRCFEHGQSNPTYFVHYAGRDLVLRKKPPGKLLPSAHAVEREYRIMKALQTQNIPVPNMVSLCEDETVLGTPFYLMDHIKGRVFKDPSLPGMTQEERHQIYMAMCEVLVRIHNVNITAAGLDDYGRKGEFVKRNFGRWAKQYEASKTEEIEDMNKLMKWLLERIPAQEECTIVHGDFRLDNLIFHPTRPEVLAVIDWELSTLGDPLTDLATNAIVYYLPKSFSVILSTLNATQLDGLGIPTVEEYCKEYVQQRRLPALDNWDFYVAFVLFRLSAILQGVYKRYTLGQASSPTAGSALEITKQGALLGLNIAAKSSLPLTSRDGGGGARPSGDQKRSYSTSAPSNSAVMTSRNYSTTAELGSLPLSVAALSPRVQDIHKKVKSFVSENILPFEEEFHEWIRDPKTKWTIHPKVEQFKEKARSQGLWNLFLPKESDHQGKYGAGLTNLEYAFLAEEMGKSLIASEAFNCSAPDTGNMEVLVKYGTEEQKEKWLRPLLNGSIRSCFGMTEPAVASSDATNIQASIVRDGDSYVLNGHKWWTSGAMDPRCKLCIFMGKTNTKASTHQQQSMILVPMDLPGVKVVRPLTLFGYDDAPHGHAEVTFENVRVPASNMLLGEGRGFEIAQGRLGPGRIHHCMRLIGSAERSLQLMVDRVQKRVAFGKPLINYNSIQQDIARSRIEIEQCRLLVLKTAHLMDTVGNKETAAEIAMIKVAVPSTVCTIVDRAIQVHGGMGVCQDLPLAHFYAQARMLRIADGPDEVHLRSICRMEAKTQNKSKL